jgi:FlaA1/EpsC-like NDP-sugar epimerase
MKNSILEWSRTTKRLVVVVMDVALAVVAMWIAFTLRLDTPHAPEGLQWLVYALAPLLAVPVFIRFGLYRAIFRYTGLAALAATTQAVAVYAVMLLALLLWLQWPTVPRSLGILQPLIFLLLVGASRAIARLWLAGQLGNRNTRQAEKRLLIYGAGAAGVQTAAAMRSGQGQYTLLGFVDDDLAKIGRSINETPVFSPAQVPNIVAKRGVTDILLALPSATRERRNEIIASLYELPVHIRTLPGLSDLTSGRVSVADFRELDIEDLLGRKPVAPDPALLASTLLGKVVLVTGAGGSIGSELCRHIVLQAPAQLVLLDHSEFALYTIHSELKGLCTEAKLNITLIPLLGSVRHYDHMAEIFQRYRPDMVYHAAAYKHVPLVESNPAEGIVNNVFGTLNMARAALEHGTARFVLISTDKAVRPTSIMGASKRVSELILQALAAHAAPLFEPRTAPRSSVQNQTCFAMVRFGNVLGSSGSVVPTFRKQLASGGPITVTHEDVTRYFMTIPEAAQLVLQAGAMAEGGDVFVLDMGAPVKIIDLARRMVALSGLTVRDQRHPEGDIEIQIVGLRPGEKLYEELLIGDNPVSTSHPRIMKAHEEFTVWPVLCSELQTLWSATQQRDVSEIKALFSRLVPGYTLSPTNGDDTARPTSLHVTPA